MEIKKNITCINCGFNGHTSKNCNFPITSFGIILYKRKSESIKYLLVQRKDSLCYTEIIRGKYDLKNVQYILKLFSNITQDEKESIFQSSFETLWEKMWVNNRNSMKREFTQSKIKFNKLKIGYFIRKHDKILQINIKYLMDNTKNLPEREWEFPKGRRKLYESDLNCAIREFEEETAIHRNMVSLEPQFKQFEELFVGKNNFRYRNVFYIASYNRDNLNESFYSIQNQDQIKEIGDVRWFDYDGVCEKLVDKIEKLEIFQRIHCQIIKK
tara:strand:- start:292 stop:1101 length:810 start_codon:yes stop_codon:yes gene_type:complete